MGIRLWEAKPKPEAGRNGLLPTALWLLLAGLQQRRLAPLNINKAPYLCTFYALYAEAGIPISAAACLDHHTRSGSWRADVPMHIVS